MDRVLIDRRNFLVALTGGAALLWFAASRNNNKVAAPSSHRRVSGAMAFGYFLPKQKVTRARSA